jgi:uncharacterized protein YwqG
MYMDKAGVQEAFIKAGLARVVKDIDFLVRPSIRISTTPVEETTLKIGASKIGGVPDLPPGANWPQWKGVPQSFIAQIRLEDAQPYDVNKVLPPAGMLWFFYDATQETYGENPADRGGWFVLFKNDDLKGLQRASAPATLPAESRFKACSLHFAHEITLPQQPELEIPHFDWTDEEQDHYEQLLSTFPDPADHAAIHHRLLGNSDTLQDDMRLQCQLTSHGVVDMDDPRVDELSKGAMDWQLLLQVDSDEHAGMRWANAGMLYYWIRQEDLRARQFDHTWLVLQSE